MAIFYLASWQLGAVEAISLSILVGTSVDYCVHLVEGYIMAGNSIPAHLTSSKVGLYLNILSDLSTMLECITLHVCIHFSLLYLLIILWVLLQ